MSAGRLPRLFVTLARPSAQGMTSLVLPVVAFAVTTALALTVLGGTIMFATDLRGGEFGGFYVMLSVLALGLLAIPAASLGATSARLSARRRDDRLATLRLLGASAADVTTLTVVEAALTALAGALVGTVLYAALMPVTGLLPFFGEPIGATAVWTGWGPLGAVVLGMTALAAISAALGLRRVRATPLGVLTRATPPARGGIRVLIGLATLVGAVVVVSVMPGLASLLGVVVLFAMLLGAILVSMLVLNLIGPPIVAARGRALARRTSNPSHLLAGRWLAEHARDAWRRVSALALVSVIAVIGGAGASIAASIPADDVSLGTIGADLRTGVLLTLGLAFAMVACTVGVTQAASALDDARLLVGLDRLGVPRTLMNRWRRQTVMIPLRYAALGGAAVGLALGLPIVGVAVFVAPEAIGIIAVTFLVGFGLVALALASTRPLVRSILGAPERTL